MSVKNLVPAVINPRRLSLREVEELAEWPYDRQPFYIDQVRRSLVSDIPQLMTQGICVTWGYDDPAIDAPDKLVGFGVIHVSTNYFEVAERRKHCYIPLLSVRPKIKSKGYGKLIVDHLIHEAEITVKHENRHKPILSEYLFLDVYVDNQRAIQRYEASGFTIINKTCELRDADESNAQYYAMAKALDCR